MSLTARHLEENGIPTVILGSARDIVEHCAVPRFVFTDFPLGNPCGRPWDASMQRAIVETGLELLETATRSQTTLKTPYAWGTEEDDAAWRASYLRIDDSNREALRRAGEKRRFERERDRQEGLTRA